MGDAVWPLNPRHTVPKAYLHVVRLWHRCRGAMGGTSLLPEPGGVNQQPAWLIHAFGVLEAAEEAMRKAERGQE